jgi:hypothetical protein
MEARTRDGDAIVVETNHRKGSVLMDDYTIQGMYDCTTLVITVAVVIQVVVQLIIYYYVIKMVLYRYGGY